MTSQPKPDQRKKYLVMLLIAAVLAVAYMVYLARHGQSLPTVSRRPGGSSVITYQEHPTAYMFGFFSMLLGMFLFVVIVETVGSGARALMRQKNAHPIYNTSSTSQTPQRVVAAILSLIIPGLGQAFAGRLARAALWVLAFLLCMLACLWMFLSVPSIIGLIVPLLIIVAFRAAVAFDAFGKVHEPIRASWGKRTAGVIGFVVLYVLAANLVAIGRGRALGESFQLNSGSMEPALMVGDYVMTVPLSGDNVVRNQIIMFRWTDDKSNRFIARAVGLSGDTLEMRNGVLFRNGQTVVEPFAFRDSATSGSGDEQFTWQKNFLSGIAKADQYHPNRDNWGPLVIPRQAFFVLGDNRNNALDSRYRGLIAAGDVSLTPARVYYSRNPDTGFRWDRIGKIVQTSKP